MDDSGPAHGLVSREKGIHNAIDVASLNRVKSYLCSADHEPIELQ
jgi:hypothetical protein